MTLLYPIGIAREAEADAPVAVRGGGLVCLCVDAVGNDRRSVFRLATALGERIDPFVPMRPVGISGAGLSGWLDRHGTALAERLDRLAGRAQLTVSTEICVTADPCLDDGYLRRRIAENTARRNRMDAVLGALTEAVQSAGLAGMPRTHSYRSAPRPGCDLSLLLPRSGILAMRARLERAIRDRGIAVRIIGPVPAYAFAEIAA